MQKSLTTMIGSLPYANPQDALDALAAFPLDIGAWPQLPKRSFKESMLVQYCEGFPGIVIDEKEKRIVLDSSEALPDAMAVFYEAVVAENSDAFAISPPFAAGLHAFIAERKKKTEKPALIKGQVVGPFTFGLSLTDRNGQAAWFDEQYRDVVIKGIGMKALWQVKQLAPLAQSVVIFLDEPIFSALGTPTYLGIENNDVIATVNEITDQLHAVDAKVGLHCCGNMEWSLLTQTNLDILAFDAYSFGDKVALYPEEIGGFLARGGLLAWGSVPTAPVESISNETTESLVRRMLALETMFTNKNIPPELLRRQRILTPSCGMGNLTAAQAQRVLKLLRECADKTGY
ncbi:MAG: hypothetical protein PHC61_11775 [Chitinivibrionales bacterium]|nr:hypothetical protein [Chitinivibrionales bacterium]